jgi:Uma2 family endonuclease
MQRDVQLVYRVPRTRPGWELPEETLPESVQHRETVDLLGAVLAYWARGRLGALVAKNLAVRWDENEPRIGIDPDVCVLVPAPPREGEDLRSVRTWKPGHAAPLVAVEVVSNTDPRKDYDVAPEKYAASGTRELWIFDPALAGPRSQGGPFLLQVWERNEQGVFVRSYADDGPAYSNALAAHLVIAGEPRRLRIADDPDGTRLWPTAEEAALARVAELEAQLVAKT